MLGVTEEQETPVSRIMHIRYEAVPQDWPRIHNYGKLVRGNSAHAMFVNKSSLLC